MQDINYNNKLIREPLIEHVGHLPIIASFLYPYLENKNIINLGRVLIMLAIHDIGETVTDDIVSYLKNTQHEKNEEEAVKSLLNTEQLLFYQELKQGDTIDAKYANSIDKLAPLLVELESPELHIARHKYYGFTIQTIINKKRPIMERNTTLLSIFDYCIATMKIYE